MGVIRINFALCRGSLWTGISLVSKSDFKISITGILFFYWVYFII